MGIAKSLRGYKFESVFEAVKLIEDQFQLEKERLSQEINRLEQDIKDRKISQKFVEPFQYDNNFTKVFNTLKIDFFGLNRNKVLVYLSRLIDLRRNDLAILYKHIQFLESERQLVSSLLNSEKKEQSELPIKIDKFLPQEFLANEGRHRVYENSQISMGTNKRTDFPMYQESQHHQTAATSEVGIESISKNNEDFRKKYIVGKVAGEDLFDDLGKKIISRNEIITDVILATAEREGKLAELVISMIIPELVDK